MAFDLAGFSSGVMSGAQAVQGIFGLVGGLGSASAARIQGEFAAARYELAAEMAQLDAEHALRMGQAQESQVRSAGRQMTSAQRSAIAAGGVAVDSGSAAQARRDTELFTDLDEATIRDMARQRAFGFRARAQEFDFRGDVARQSASFSASMSIMNGVNQMVDGLSRAMYTLAQGLPDSREDTSTAYDGTFLTEGTGEMQRKSGLHDSRQSGAAAKRAANIAGQNVDYEFAPTVITRTPSATSGVDFTFPPTVITRTPSATSGVDFTFPPTVITRTPRRSRRGSFGPPIDPFAGQGPILPGRR